MKLIRKIPVFLLTMMLCFGMMAVPAFAASSTQDGLEVTLTTDKKTYNKDEQIAADLTVTNTNDIAVVNVSLENLVPDGYKLADGSEAAKHVESLGAGEMISLTVIYVPENPGDSGEQPGYGDDAGDTDKPGNDDNAGDMDESGAGDDTGDTDKPGNGNSTDIPEQPGNSDNAGSGNNTGAGNNNTGNGAPGNDSNNSGSSLATGDNSNPALWIVLLVLACGGIITLIVLKKKSGKKLLSLFLCITMLTSILAGTPVRADTVKADARSIDISTTVEVDGEQIKMMAAVLYQLIDDIDADEDGVSDAIEEFWGTSTETDDTDGDGLSDYFEIFKSDTDPTIKDSDENGIPDGDKDSDEDGLTNLEEQKHGTIGNKSDSDGDGLSDGKEVLELGTDPLKQDTDDDGLTDDEEIILGLDPLSPVTDGETPDGERTFYQQTDDSVKDEVLISSDNWLTPTISGNVTGVINNNIQMSDTTIHALESNRSVVSDFIDVYTAYEIPVTLTFHYSKSYTGDIINLNIMTYSEDDLVPVDTIIDEDKGTISADISESGTYFVMDLDEFLKSLGIDVFSSISGSDAVSAFSAESESTVLFNNREKVYAENYVNSDDDQLSDAIENEEIPEEDTVFEETEGTETVKETAGTETVEETAGTEIVEETADAVTVEETAGTEIVEETAGTETAEETADTETVEDTDDTETAEETADTETAEETADTETVKKTVDIERNKNRAVPEKTIQLETKFHEADVMLAAAATGKADVVFVIDTTGSMSSAITRVKNNISTFSKALVEKYNIDVNFALIEYRDITYDGEDSTVLHKNVSGNWFTSVDSYISQVNSLSVDGGGDTPETPIDALEMARLLDWRSEAAKFVILVTDANYKTDNLCGISDMEEMGQRLLNNGIVTSAIARYSSDYNELIGSSGGLYGYIYGDFSDILLKLADMVGEETNAGGEWVLLDDYQSVKLSDTLENAETNDTDHDGYSDAKELGASEDADLSVYIYLLLNKHSVPKEYFTGLTTLKVWNYISNPTLLDTDFDGISDGTKDYDGSTVAKPDENPRGTDGNRFRGKVTNNDFTFDVSFKVDYSLFFGRLTAYNDKLSQLGIIYSIGAYHSDYTINHGADFKGNDEALMENFGMKDVTPVKLANSYMDDDLSEITMGHRKVTYQGVTKEIIFVSVRGTDATIEEWSSNFDVGADTDEYWDRNNEDWKNKNHHKGFDVAANRLNKSIQNYIAKLDDSTQKVIFFTGHSRGAAIANILASMYVDDGYKTVAYTFATPNTTLEKNTSSYKTIFNIVNGDDLVPYLPLKDWGYDKYGKTYTVSIEDTYEDKFGAYDSGTWEAMFDCDYNYNGNRSDTLKAFKKVADNRDALYKFTGKSNTKYTYGTHYDTEKAAKAALKKLRNKYGSRISKFCKFYTVEVDPLIGKNYYQVRVEQTPAAMMMIITDVVGSKMHMRDAAGQDRLMIYSQRGAGEDTFYGKDVGFYVAKKYSDAKKQFVWSGSDSASDAAMTVRMGGMLHSHMPGTYYLIAKDSKNKLP